MVLNNNNNNRRPSHPGSPSASSYVNFQSESRTPQRITISWKPNRSSAFRAPMRNQNRTYHRSSPRWIRSSRSPRTPTRTPHPGAPRNHPARQHQTARQPPEARYKPRRDPFPGEPFPPHWSVWGSDNPWANENNKCAQVKVDTLVDSVDHLSARLEAQVEKTQELAEKVAQQQRQLLETKRSSQTLVERTKNNYKVLTSILSAVSSTKDPEPPESKLATSALACRKENGTPHPKVLEVVDEKDSDSDSE